MMKTISRMSAFGRLLTTQIGGSPTKNWIIMGMKNNIKVIKVFLLVLTLSLSSGCLIIPLPASSPSMNAFEQNLWEIPEGATKREEVISIIGKPDIMRKGFILYKSRVQSNETRIVYGAAIPLPPRTAIPLFEGEKRIQGDWMDVVFEFDVCGFFTEYRFIEHKDDSPYPFAAECFSDTKSNYYSCLTLTEEKNDPLSQCEEILEANLETCNLIEALNIEKDCDPGMESCSKGEADKTLVKVEGKYYEAKYCKLNCKSTYSKCIKTTGVTNINDKQCKQENQVCMQECPAPWPEPIKPQQTKDVDLKLEHCDKRNIDYEIKRKMIKQKWSPGLVYCMQDCDSDFKSCTESTDGKASEEEKCQNDKSACYLKCSDWDSGVDACPSCGLNIPDPDCDPGMESCD